MNHVGFDLVVPKIYKVPKFGPDAHIPKGFYVLAAEYLRKCEELQIYRFYVTVTFEMDNGDYQTIDGEVSFRFKRPS